MIRIWIGRTGCALLLAGIAAASAQERVVGPLPSLAPLVEEVAPAVVNISIQGTVASQLNLFPEDLPFDPRLFGIEPEQEREFRAAGSGVIVDAEQGYLLTNHHVVENANEITVTLVDNRTFTATVVGSDASSDLAVLQIEADDLTDISFSTTDDLKVGDYVVAIGNPLGLTNTVTAGIVSALGRGINPGDNSVYEDFIQTDASINVGNSGGALVNLRGELVGINSAIISQTGGNIGIGLSIPVELAGLVMNQLIEFGDVQHGLLGVRMRSIEPDIAEALNLTVTEGALVTEVEPGSAAESADIRVDDVIVGVDGQSVENGNELRNRIGFKRPGEEVNIDVIRGGRSMTIAAILGARPEDTVAELPAPLPRQPKVAPVLPGVELSEGQRFGMTGLIVDSIEADSPAALRGLQQGDLITAINRRRIETLDEARAIVDSARFLFLQVRRGGRDFLLELR